MLLSGINYISNHGTSQGILTRFFLHFEKMAEMGFMGKRWPAAKSRYELYEKKNKEDFTNFYDTYHEVMKLREEYLQGVNNGTYFSINLDGSTSSDSTPEILIRKRIKEFFISGRQLLNNFGKSGLLEDGDFKVSSFLLYKESVVEKYIKTFSENFRYKQGYLKIIDIAKKAQVDFKKDFMQLRADIEHDYDTEIPKFKICAYNREAVVEEPTYNGTNFFILIDKYYHGTLNLIEDMAAYFYGVNACANTDGKITLFFRKDEVDPPRFRFRYALTLDVGDPSLQRLINPRRA